MKSRLIPGIGFITLAALVVRIALTTWTGLATDEANGAMIAVTGSWLDMLVHLRDDGNAPLFYAIMREYAQLFGYHGASLKIMMIGLATAAVPITYLIFRRFLPRDLCLALAWMLAFCPTYVIYGVLIRPYVLSGVLGVVSTLCCMRVLSAGTNWKRVLAYAVSTALVVYTHYWGAFVPIGHVGLVIVGLARRWFGRREVVCWFAGAVLSYILFLPQALSVCMVLYGATYNLTPFDAPPRPVSLTCDFIPNLLLSVGVSPHFQVMCMMLTCYLLVFTAFISPKVMMIESPDREKSDLASTPEGPEAPVETQTGGASTKEYLFDGRMWKTATVCGLAAGFLVDLFSPSLRFRYLLPFVPMVFVVCVTGFNALFARHSRLVRVTLPCALWISIFIPYLMANAGLPETTANMAVDTIVSQADRKKDAVLIGWEVIAPAINFDMPEDIESISYPHMERISISKWTDMLTKLRQDDVLPQLFGKLDSVIARGGKIWFIDALHPIRPLDYRAKDLVKDDPFKILTVARTDQIRSWLLGHAVPVGETQVARGRDFNITLSVFAPPGKDPAAQSALLKPQSLWETVDPEENIKD